MTIIKARPTVYAGIQMRSRLEASFAEMLDSTLIEWSYEGQCYASKDGQYLPDFHVYFHWRDDWEYCEVKPENADFAAALRKMHVILASEPLARLGVWTRCSVPNHMDRLDGDDTPCFHPVTQCTPDDPCDCDREKWPRGYDRP